MNENSDARDGAPPSAPGPRSAPISALDEAGLKLRIVLVLPAWVAIVSLFILRRERQRSRAGAAARA